LHGRERRVKVRDVEKRLRDEGWYQGRQSGSHRIYKHLLRPDARVVIAGHPGDDIPAGTLHSIFEQAGWGKP
jgi:predicted RNA binding protein YcfA (HicA-like mRNA interferase family)